MRKHIKKKNAKDKSTPVCTQCSCIWFHIEFANLFFSFMICEAPHFAIFAFSLFPFCVLCPFVSANIVCVDVDVLAAYIFWHPQSIYHTKHNPYFVLCVMFNVYSIFHFRAREYVFLLSQCHRLHFLREFVFATFWIIIWNMCRMVMDRSVW